MMEFDIIEAIAKRKSKRTFTVDLIPTEVQNLIKKYIESQTIGPFGTKINFHLIDINYLPPHHAKKYGSFGLTKQTGYFILGSILFSDYNLEDYGYLLEKILLFTTQFNLGTCWISSFFNQTAFGSLVGQPFNESIPALVMIGNPAVKSNFFEKLTRLQFNTERRKPFLDLFFEGDFSRPINCSKKSKYLLALEMVRKAPSNKNNQPWRIVKNNDEKIFHFYLQPSKNLVSTNYYSLNRIEMGIAMAHFSESMDQLLYPGTWSINDPGIKLPNRDIRYIATWSV